MTSARPSVAAPVGTFCLVLHAHLPWLAHHGTWPVGEEWLHEAWSGCYLPLVEVLHRLADEGRRDLVTLGVTPVLAAQLDDPYCLREQRSWLGRWQLRAEELAARREPHLQAVAAAEFRAAREAMAGFDRRWSTGGSAALRPLADCGAVELLGGPATHPFLPLLTEPTAAFALRVGLDDATLRLGRRPGGIWAPECGYAPGLERLYDRAGVTHLVADEATVTAAGRGTDAAWTIAGSSVAVVARDLAVTDRIWSSRTGYPVRPEYRDFHTYDHPTGLRVARVTSPATPPERKAPYDSAAAAAAVERDAAEFAGAVRDRLLEVGAGRGRPGLVVAAYDAELFGHWWHEGPAFLEAVLRRLPDAGVRVSTLAGAIAAGHVEGRVDLGPGSWGAGKDFRVWSGDRVVDLVTSGRRVEQRLHAAAAGLPACGAPRRPDLDQLAREALLALSSDWAFMVSRDSAASYARARAEGHARAVERLADALELGAPTDALVGSLRAADGPFGHLDARLLRGQGWAADQGGGQDAGTLEC